MVESQILNSFYGLTDQFVSFIPTLLAVIILIIVGWILGKLLGNFGSKILDKIGLDDLIDKTVLGGMINKGGMSTVGFFAAVIRWFVYLIFVVIIVDLLQIQIVADFITQIIQYIPLIVSALLVLLIGLFIVDFIANLIKTVIVATDVDDKIMKSDIGETLASSGLKASSIIAGLVKLFGYLIFITAAVEILQFRMITEFLFSVIDYLPSLLTGILILIIGFLTIDFFMDYIQATMKGMNVEGADVVLPLFKGFLFLIIILMALDIMLINTSIFYVFLGPMAWGFAIVVAFRWGVKEAIVAYAEAKK
ncbi:MAG: mechanosensitive ion channel family protein [Methanosarcinaceae archaeon]